MDIQYAYQHLARQLLLDTGKFFARGSSVSLGTGKIYGGIRYPLYDTDTQIFGTVMGSIYVLTHECDIDQDNRRPFNTEVLICPIIPFELFVEEYMRDHSDDQLLSFLGQLGKREISRVAYLPVFSKTFLPYGGILYFNQIANTHISAFYLEDAQERCVLTRYGLQIIDYFLENHFLRPKAEQLPLARY